MARVRVFYGHEGVIPPHGPRRAVAGAPAPASPVETPPQVDDTNEEVTAAEATPDEATETDDAGTPDESWTVARIDDWAEAHGVAVHGTKAEKLADITAALEG